MIVHRFRIVAALLFTFMMSIKVNAQQRYPVSGSIVIAYPSSSMAEYASAFNASVGVTLLLNDFNLSGHRVSLRFTISRGNDILAQSKEQLIGEPVITLQGGVPEQLQRSVVGYYFLEENLNWQSARNYSSALDEGNYTFSLRVSDYTTGRLLSASISQFFPLTYNDPPLLNLPAPDAGIKALGAGIAPVYFQWTPRGQQISHTQYVVTIKEIPDPGGNKDNQFLAGTAYYTTNMPISGTMLNYDPAGNSEFPPLQEGMLYGWQVQAVPENGYESAIVYKADGYSPIRYFTYQSNCPVIESINVESKSPNRIIVNWPPLAEHTGYIVSYRKENTEDWFYTEPVTGGYYNLAGLQAATTYEIRIGGACLLPQRQVNAVVENPQAGQGLLAGHTVIYNMPKQATTLAEGEMPNIICGQIPDINLANQQPIEQLQVNDIIKAGDFDVVLTKVTGGKESWSGEGWTSVLPFGDVRWALHFEGIKVNTDKQLVSGAFETVYDATDNAIVDADEWIDKARELYDELFRDDDAEKIDALVNGLLGDAIPEEIKQQLKDALDDLNEARDELIAARQLYENTPDEPAAAKEEARKKLERAEEKFSQAKAAMQAALDKKDDFMKAYIDLVKLALQRIIKTSEDSFGQRSLEIKQAFVDSSKDNSPRPVFVPENRFMETLFSGIPLDGNKKAYEVAHAYNNNITAQRLSKFWSTNEGIKDLSQRLKKPGLKCNNLVETVHNLQKQDGKEDKKIDAIQDVLSCIIEEVTNETTKL